MEDFKQDIITALVQLNQKLNNSQSFTPQVYTIVEVADILKCKESTIRHIVFRTHELPTCKIGKELRIRDEDLKKFLANRVSSCVFDKGVLP